MPATGIRFTRSTRSYQVSREEPHSPGLDVGLPILVVGLSLNRVTKLSEGPALTSTAAVHANFWAFLHSLGGTWMWEVIERGKDTLTGEMWIVDGLRNDSLIWATDGSYDQKKASDLSGVGWIIFCTRTGFRVTGTFWERSTSASSYRAKLLGLCVFTNLHRQ